MNIVLTDCLSLTNGDLDLTVMEKYGSVTYWPSSDDDHLLAHIQDADVVICNSVHINRAVLEACPRLKYIGLFSTGYNHIDVLAAREQGIDVSNAGSYSTNAVAQQTFAFILDHYNKVRDYDTFVRQGGWINATTFSPMEFPMDELSGKTIGIVGYGSIGQAAARIASAFGMRVLAYSRTPKNDLTVTFCDFDTLLRESDVISLHCPLTPETRDLLNEKAFQKCKKGAFLVNTARGPIVNEQALKNALEAGILSGAAVDVLNEEPMRPDCILYNLPNLVMTPHVSWAPLATRQRVLNVACKNLEAWMNGKPTHIVN